MQCKICDTKINNINIIYRLEEFDVLQCPSCGLIFISVDFSAQELVQLYSKEYFELRKQYYFDNIIVNQDKGQEDENIKDFRHYLDLLEAFKNGNRLLDVGCGLGIFLCMARERGWEVYGVDISPYAAEFARQHFNLEVYATPLDKAGFEDGFFDVITLLDSFEHFPDPGPQLAVIHRILKDEGLLFLNTPNANGLLRKIAHLVYGLSGGKVSYPVKKLYHKYHVCYYTPQTLELIFKKYGFYLCRLERKVIRPIKARGTIWEKKLVQGISILERLLHLEYELIAIVKKTTPALR